MARYVKSKKSKKSKYNIIESLNEIKGAHILNIEKYFFSLKNQNPKEPIFIELFVSIVTS